ncbi:SDR family oxidoreductase [Flavobacterium artemisiae]|uniref:SDR family oxidoreductase n=1 Tax=Flavobacterium artemisiae TaxID=2126556 RepID=A0ABW4HIA0_9FLAO
MKKTVLITGASAGIGKAAAKKFASSGWNVIATMRSPEKENELNLMENVLLTKLDVQDNESIKNAINLGIETFGQIDTLINNAGFGVYGIFELSSEEQIRKQFEVNVFGVMNTVKAIIPYFRAKQSGTIINISSKGGRVAFPAISLYHASKFAIEGFSESLSYELATQNITVKIVEPGVVSTGFDSAASFTSHPQIKVYDDFVDKFLAQWSSLHTEPSTAEQVAEVIYTAASDQTSQLRYIAGNDAEMAIAQRENNSDSAYIQFMKDTYVPKM